MTQEQLYEYLEQLASSHVLVNHVPNSKNAGDKHFFRGELEEFYMDLRNRVNFPAVVAESFEVQFYDGKKVRESSFIIAADYRESKDWDGIVSALRLCERIGDEFIRRIGYDDENGDLCGNIDFVSAVPILNEQRLYAGMRYTFTDGQDFDEEPNKDMWKDLNTI